VSESKHTPGPWIVDTADSVRVLANDTRATIVANVTGAVSNPTAIADARLIAAAPDLLAACRVFANLSEYRNLINEMAMVLRPYERDAFKAAFQSASAAIAKAEGR
jgi:hypothetical protein